MATYPQTAGDLAVDLDKFPGAIAWQGVGADRWKRVPADEHAEALSFPQLLAVEALHPRYARVRRSHTEILGLQTGWE